MAHFRAVARVGRVRRSATDVPDEWSSPAVASVTVGTEPGLQTAWHLLHKPSSTVSAQTCENKLYGYARQASLMNFYYIHYLIPDWVLSRAVAGKEHTKNKFKLH